MATFNPVPTAFQTIPWFNTAPFVTGYEWAYVSATVFSLAPGGARAYSTDVVALQSTLEINTTEKIFVDVSTVGVNGCWPLPLSFFTADTVLPVYVLEDSSGGNATAAVVATGNNFLPPGVLPTGYDSWRRVASIYINHTTDELYAMTQYGSNDVRRYQLAAPLTALSGGAADTATAIVLNSGALPVPTYAIEVIGNLSFTPGTVGDSTMLNDTATATGQVILQPSAQAIETIPYSIAPSLVSGAPTIYYTNSTTGGATTVTVSGWVESLALNIV